MAATYSACPVSCGGGGGVLNSDHLRGDNQTVTTDFLTDLDAVIQGRCACRCGSLITDRSTVRTGGTGADRRWLIWRRWRGYFGRLRRRWPKRSVRLGRPWGRWSGSCGNWPAMGRRRPICGNGRCGCVGTVTPVRSRCGGCRGGSILDSGCVWLPGVGRRTGRCGRANRAGGSGRSYAGFHATVPVRTRGSGGPGVVPVPVVRAGGGGWSGRVGRPGRWVDRCGRDAAYRIDRHNGQVWPGYGLHRCVSTFTRVMSRAAATTG